MSRLFERGTGLHLDENQRAASLCNEVNLRPTGQKSPRKNPVPLCTQQQFRPILGIKPKKIGVAPSHAVPSLRSASRSARA